MVDRMRTHAGSCVVVQRLFNGTLEPDTLGLFSTTTVWLSNTILSPMEVVLRHWGGGRHRVQNPVLCLNMLAEREKLSHY